MWCFCHYLLIIFFQPHDDPIDPRLQQGYRGQVQPGGWDDRDSRLGDASEPENRFESPHAQQLLERAREIKQRPFWNPYNGAGNAAAGMNYQIYRIDIQNSA